VTLPALKVETLGQLLAKSHAQREELITPWLKAGESALVYAPTGVGKSLFTLTAALAVAGSGRFLGWTAKSPRRVLLVDGEMHEADLIERCRELLPTVAETDDAALLGNLSVLARQAQHPDADFPDLATQAGQDAVLERVRVGGFELLILDNFSTLASCDDENSAAAMQPVQKFLMRLKQAGVACILVHHANKGGNSYRGSTMLATTFEVIVALKRSEDWTPDQGAAFSLDWEKYRGKPDPSVVPLKVRLDASGWSFGASEALGLRRLVELVRSMDYPTQTALAEAAGISKGEASKRKQRAIAAGLIDAKEWSQCLEAAGDAQGGAVDF
jgi:KaiC/GvpD/RAD55 family RecA-like ATPase